MVYLGTGLAGSGSWNLQHSPSCQLLEIGWPIRAERVLMDNSAGGGEDGSQVTKTGGHSGKVKLNLGRFHAAVTND